MDKEYKNYIPVSDIKRSGKPFRRFGYRPVLAGLITLALGLGLICMWDLTGWICGGLITLLGLGVLFLTPRRRVIDIYSDGVVVYDKEDDTRAMFLSYRSVSDWAVQRSNSGSQSILFLIGGEQYVITETFALMSVRRPLRKFAPASEMKVPPAPRR